MFCRRGGINELAQYGFRIAVECHIGTDDFPNFFGVEFNVNDFRLFGKVRYVTRYSVVKTHAYGYEYICILDRIIDPSVAMHAGHTQIQRVVGRKSTESEERMCDWDVQLFCEVQ